MIRVVFFGVSGKIYKKHQGRKIKTKFVNLEGKMSARELLKKYEIEINKHNFNLIEPLVSKDCKFWFSSGTYQGIEQVREAFEKTWDMIKEEVYSITEIEWIAESESSAVCTYTFKWKGLIKGELSEGKGRGTSCFRLESNEWKIVHEHLSNFPR